MNCTNCSAFAFVFKVIRNYPMSIILLSGFLSVAISLRNRKVEATSFLHSMRNISAISSSARTIVKDQVSQWAKTGLVLSMYFYHHLTFKNDQSIKLESRRKIEWATPKNLATFNKIKLTCIIFQWKVDRGYR